MTMTLNRFRAEAHALVDWMADYLEGVRDRPVSPGAAPGDVVAALPESPPEDAEPFDRQFADFERIIMPAMTHWQHPGFFGYFPANSSPPSVLAEMLTATLGAQCMSWQTAPAATELEQRMMVWLAKMIGLPSGFTGVIQDSASSATLCAILTARERASDGWTNQAGLTAGTRHMTVYGSSECHSSIEKAVRIAGLGAGNFRKVAVDDTGAMDPDALERAISDDRAEGRLPICVVAALGSTGTGAVDPLPAIAEICARHGVWLHVDAAWAGSALILPECRWIADGVAAADSFVFNPHKWLFTNFDCSAYFVKDPAALVNTLGIQPEYLKTPGAGAMPDYRDWGVPLGRRFRALKLWFVIRTYGVSGLQAKLRDHIAWAGRLGEAIAATPGFELVTAPSLALVTFRFRPAGATAPAAVDRANQDLLAAINGTGRAFLSHTRFRGAYVIRFAIGQTATRWEDVARAWHLIRSSAHAMEPHDG